MRLTHKGYPAYKHHCFGWEPVTSDINMGGYSNGHYYIKCTRLF